MSEKKKTIWKVKEDVYKWLMRLGVHEGDINIKSDASDKNKATVTYVYKKQDYVLSTAKERNYTGNLHNVEKLIHSRVLGVERGIETMEQAFAGYKTLPDYSGYFKDCNSPEEANKVFKQLSKQFHPDAGGNTESFNELQKQFETFKLKNTHT